VYSYTFDKKIKTQVCCTTAEAATGSTMRMMKNGKNNCTHNNLQYKNDNATINQW